MPPPRTCRYCHTAHVRIFTDGTSRPWVVNADPVPYEHGPDAPTDVWVLFTERREGRLYGWIRHARDISDARLSRVTAVFTLHMCSEWAQERYRRVEQRTDARWIGDLAEDLIQALAEGRPPETPTDRRRRAR